jgi:hemolysin activation/secretion protein
LTPLELNKKRFNFMSSLSMQISEDELFAAQSFSIGGQGSVRGFWLICLWLLLVLFL